MIAAIFLTLSSAGLTSKDWAAKNVEFSFDPNDAADSHGKPSRPRPPHPIAGRP